MLASFSLFKQSASPAASQIYGIAAAGMPCKCPGCGPRRRPSRATLAARERDRQQQQGGAAADEAAADGEQQLERRHGPGEAEQSEDDGTSAENGDASGDGSKQAAEPPLGQDDAYVALCTAVKGKASSWSSFMRGNAAVEL